MKAAARSLSHSHVRHYRERMAAQGFRQLQIWVPDTKAKKFAADCRKQSLLATKQETPETLQWLDESVSALEGWKK